MQVATDDQIEHILFYILYTFKLNNFLTVRFYLCQCLQRRYLNYNILFNYAVNSSEGSWPN